MSDPVWPSVVRFAAVVFVAAFFTLLAVAMTVRWLSGL